ncbi:MAG: Gfo/Idh/MocA family oxidoreductase [Chloroflexota bacterium]
MMDKIRWGIVGCGDVTEVKSGPALQKTPHSSLVAVMRRSGELAKDYAERHGVPKWVDDADRLINDPEVNAVYVATPPSSHKELTIAALKAGKPVYVEKPMALDHRECLEMLDAARQAEQPLFVAYYRRALPRFLKVKALLEAEAIGEVRTVDVKRWQPARSADFYRETQPWRVDPSIAGGGYFVDLASHMLDLLDFLLGPIDAAQGYAGNQGGLY